MSNRTLNEAIATGHAFRDYDPIKALQALQAAVGYNDGFVIRLGKDQNAFLYRLLTDTIAFHTGGESAINRSAPNAGGEGK